MVGLNGRSGANEQKRLCFKNTKMQLSRPEPCKEQSSSRIKTTYEQQPIAVMGLPATLALMTGSQDGRVMDS